MMRRMKYLACGVALALTVSTGFAFAEEPPEEGVGAPPGYPGLGSGISIEGAFSDEALRAAVSEFDTDEDGLLSPTERAGIDALSLTGVANLEGIEYLTSLATLSIGESPQLESLALASDSLVTLEISGCSSLKLLDVSACTALETLQCANNALESIAFPAQLLKACTFAPQVNADSLVKFLGWADSLGASANEAFANFAESDEDYAARAGAVAGATVYAAWKAPDFSLGTWEQVGWRWRFMLDGQPVKDRKVSLNGKLYFFDADGWMCSGWKKDGADWYYLGLPDQGSAQSGWQYLGGKWYYFDETTKAMAHGWRCLDAWYFFGLDEDDGAMKTGWLKDEGRWYYLGGSGAMQTGWLYDGSAWFYLSGSGAMETGWNYHGAWYYFGLGDDGAMRTGWLEDEGHWYYLQPSGAMTVGWTKAGSLWYYFAGSGIMLSGWQSIGAHWYYLGADSEGFMQTGWRQLDGIWYFFGDANDGAMKTGWANDRGTWYYFSGSGAMQTGWLSWGGNWYYLHPWGAMATGFQTIDGTTYYFDGSGVMRDLTADELDMTVRAQGYSSSTNWLIMVDTTRNQLGIFYGSRGNWGLVHFWQCSTGAAATPTVLGEYQVTGKGYSFGSGFTCYYWTQFYGDYLIHSVTYYQNTFTVMEGKMGVNISHGCVRLPIERAKWIYDNIPYWTKVVTYR